MSGANADRRDPAASVDEWRVDVDAPSQPVADPADSGREWSRAAVSQHRERVSTELSSWREELTERMRRLERRLDDSGNAPD
jgi:hypothetical protein